MRRADLSSPVPGESPMPAPLDVPIPPWQLAALGAGMPDWATASAIYRDADGRIVGFGMADRRAGVISVEAGSSVVRLVAVLLQAKGG
jgi:hypothetical protein